jgi:negative regulator of flagellin synthesis FlgM
MTDAISQYGRMAQSDRSVRSALDREASAVDVAPVKSPARPGADTLSLSNVAQKAMQEPGFDRVKVDAIKQAIQQGQYPLESRRIAESFMAIEKMIGD